MRKSIAIVNCATLASVTIVLLCVQTSRAGRSTPQVKGQAARETSKAAPASSRPVRPGPSSFRPDMPFAEAIDILRHSTKPPLNIAVLWKDLEENADIYRDTTIGIDGLSGISLRMHLKLLLMGVSAGSPAELGYTVDGGVIVIATKESLPIKMKTRIYYVADLTAPPANYFFFPAPGMPIGLPMGGLGGLGLGGGYGMGYPGGASGMYPGGSYGYGGGLTGLLQNRFGTTGGSYGYSRSSRTR
ncbi:MAG: hypothetical protein P8Z79_03190 [Sedimentisphaerales bacterium]|jgi:hypothetical protein